MMLSLPFTSPSLLLLAVGTLVLIVYHAIQHIQLQRRRAAFKLENGAKDIGVLVRPWDYFGLANVYKIMQAAGKKKLLDYFTDQFVQHGDTYATVSGGSYAFMTRDPENFKALHATKFDDWLCDEVRTGFHELLGRGIFTTDGPVWRQSRDLLRPQFEKRQFAEVEQFEAHVQALMRNIPEGETVDLQDLFHKLTMDSASQLFSGRSMGLLSDNANEDDLYFNEAFEICCHDGTARNRLGWMYYLFPHTAAKKAMRFVHAYAGRWVERALEVRKQGGGKIRDKKGGQYVFLEELARDEAVEPEKIKLDALSVMLAGRDTTAGLLACLFFELARHPEALAKLRAEVDELHGELPGYDRLREMKYLKYCAQEALRLYPPAPLLVKKAAVDTVLPRGGGPKGEDPLFCAKGDSLFYVHYSMMRSEEYYGKDAAEFKPERWLDPEFRPGWAYLPFGGGTRTCIGQQYALTMAYYVTVRLMQEYSQMENRDPEPFVEELTITLCSHNGTKVALFK